MLSRLLAVVGLVALLAWFALARPAVADEPGPGRSRSHQTRSRRAKPVDPAGEVARPADYRSEHFYIHTDLSAAEAHELLERLETMLGLIADYWGRPPSGIIECYVVKDLKLWDGALPDAEGREKIAEGAGLTVSRTLARGNQFLAKAVVYAVADHGTPQHEAVHAYCAQTFGSVGPTWYGEGMAEMGHYWRKDDPSVQIEDVVLKYLRESEAKTIEEIVNRREFTGDSWRNYAWRWALCHLLANNTNYAAEFRPLGLALLTRQAVSFEQVYGDRAREIEFEYGQFLKDLAQGYRADLCSWDWQKRFVPVRASAMTTRIQAARGWQPTGATVSSGKTYSYTATGAWQLDDEDDKLTAEGNDAGQGRLIGAIFRDYKLGSPIELGAKGTFEAPSDGNLYVRCRDDWGSLGDNEGQVTLKLRVAKK